MSSGLCMTTYTHKDSNGGAVGGREGKNEIEGGEEREHVNKKPHNLIQFRKHGAIFPKKKLILPLKCSILIKP